jgi:hypothetical protein
MQAIRLVTVVPVWQGSCAGIEVSRTQDHPLRLGGSDVSAKGIPYVSGVSWECILRCWEGCSMLLRKVSASPAAWSMRRPTMCPMSCLRGKRAQLF